MNEVGPGQAFVAALLVGALYAIGGAARVAAGAITIVVLITPGPDGRSLGRAGVEAVTRYLTMRPMRGDENIGDA